MELAPLLMRVFVMKHANGSPRKYWCCHQQQDGRLLTRFGAAGNVLQERISSSPVNRIRKERDKEASGYEYEGEFMVNTAINRDEKIPTPIQAVPHTSKFENLLLHWVVKQPIGDVEIDQICEILKTTSGIKVNRMDSKLEIIIGSQKIVFKPDMSLGIIKKDIGDWKASVVLLRLNKVFDISIVDESANQIKLTKNNIKNFLFANDVLNVTDTDEFDQFCQDIALISKIDEHVKEAMSMFF